MLDRCAVHGPRRAAARHRAFLHPQPRHYSQGSRRSRTPGDDRHLLRELSVEAGLALAKPVLPHRVSLEGGAWGLGDRARRPRSAPGAASVGGPWLGPRPSGRAVATRRPKTGLEAGAFRTPRRTATGSCDRIRGHGRGRSVKLVDMIAGGAHPPEIWAVFAPITDGCALLVATFASSVQRPPAGRLCGRPKRGQPVGGGGTVRAGGVVTPSGRTIGRRSPAVFARLRHYGTAALPAIDNLPVVGALRFCTRHGFSSPPPPSTSRVLSLHSSGPFQPTQAPTAQPSGRTPTRQCAKRPGARLATPANHFKALVLKQAHRAVDSLRGFPETVRGSQMSVSFGIGAGSWPE